MACMRFDIVANALFEAKRTMRMAMVRMVVVSMFENAGLSF